VRFYIFTAQKSSHFGCFGIVLASTQICRGGGDTTALRPLVCWFKVAENRSARPAFAKRHQHDRFFSRCLPLLAQYSDRDGAATRQSGHFVGEFLSAQLDIY
jgi:hypothetical protein